MKKVRYTSAVKYTIVWSLGLSIGLILILVYQNLHNISFNAERLYQLANVNNTVIARLNDLENVIKERTLILLRLVDESDPFKVDDGLMRHRQLASEFVVHREAVEPLLVQNDEKELFRQVMVLVSESQPLHNRLVDALEQGNTVQALEIREGLYKKQIELYENLSLFVDHMEEHNRESVLVMGRSADKTYSTSLAISAIVILFFLFMAVLVSRYIFSQSDALESYSLKANSDKLLAMQANEAKSLFIANVSHEIRTPLTAINGAIALIQNELEKRSDDALRDIVDIAHRNTQRLMVLLRDVLDFSKIETGNFGFEYSEFQIYPELNEVVDLFKPMIFDKGLNFYFSFHSDEHKSVILDRDRLRQVLVNLLSNAIKFTAKGHVSMHAMIAGEGDDETLEITISDSGIGIPKSKQGLIFESFTQADPSTTRVFGGTGIGLSICKHLVEGMGGVIRVDSEEGAGSLFMVVLPTRRKSGEGGVEDSVAVSV